MSTLQFLVTLSILVALGYLLMAAVTAIVAALRTGGRREDTAQHDALSVSRFTIPVSVIVPASNDVAAATRTIEAALALNYPEFEVIAVVEGMPDEVLRTFVARWALDAKEFFYRRSIDTAPVRRLYRSQRDPRFTVVDKAAGGDGDAINCGVNIARYRYVTSIAPGVVFGADALLRVMSAALHDPASVLGASSHVERGTTGRLDTPGAGMPVSDGGVLKRISGLFERLDSLRSLMESRLAWRYLRSGLGPHGAVAVWRRDAVLQVNGFSSTAADANLDMMFRLQTSSVDGGRARFHRGSEVFGYGHPRSLREALREAGRRQVAALEIISSCLRVGTRGLGLKTLTYFVEFELLTPLAQAWVVIATVAGAAAGWFTWSAVVLAALLLSFGNSAVTAAAILLRGSAAGAPDETELRRLLVAGPLEFLLYRPALALARIVAAARFATGV